MTPARGYNASFWISDLVSNPAFQNSLVDFYPVGMFGHGTGTQPYFLSVPKAFKEMSAPSATYDGFDGSASSTYIQWNIGYEDWMEMQQHGPLDFLPTPFKVDFEWIKQCWSTDSERTKFLKDHHWRILLVGVEGAGMFNHKDTLRTASWQAVLSGSKRFHLCSAENDPYIYKAGELDAFAPDYVRFPQAKHLDCFLDEIAAGEIMYYPRDYWHQSKNLHRQTMALTGTIVNAWNFDSVTEQMLQTYISQGVMSNKRECDSLRDGHQGKFCEGLQICFDYWLKKFGEEWLNLTVSQEKVEAIMDTEHKHTTANREGLKAILKAGNRNAIIVTSQFELVF